MRISFRSLVFCLALVSALPAFCEQKPKKDNIQKPIAGPRATALQVTWLFVSPDRGAQKVDRVQPGRELVIAEKSGPGSVSTPTPISRNRGSGTHR